MSQAIRDLEQARQRNQIEHILEKLIVALQVQSKENAYLFDANTGEYSRVAGDADIVQGMRDILDDMSNVQSFRKKAIIGLQELYTAPPQPSNSLSVRK